MIDDSAPDGYPIVNYEYGIIPAKESSTQVAQAVQAFLYWAVDPNKGSSATFLDQVNFQPLPPTVRALSQEQIAKITG
jgi:phosphate transport system substrate-binding protein